MTEKRNLGLSALFLLCSTALITACGAPAEEPKEAVLEGDPYKTVDLAQAFELQDGEMKVFTLPTPLQISTMLQMSDVEFNGSSMLDTDNPPNVPSSFNKALCLGMYTIDFGYATVYGRGAESAGCAKVVKQLMGELGIVSNMQRSLLERYEANKTQPDSLSHIVLEAYSEAHKYFEDNGREGLGVLILAGSYVEGLHLTLNSDLAMMPTTRDQIMVQQKYFLENLNSLLNAYNNSAEMNGLMQEMKRLETAFANLQVDFNEEADNPYVLRRPIQPETMDMIRDTVSNIRASVLTSA